ncbi:hypothetical protein OTK49_17720 [Vibrio coralliirubri]|uniref:hypothetical protein n=1 Tax=Vibrio coralliirubri TaxID=1516159 RepID=UPI002283824E|nr:hypothetical protein [Vibrio coralliirubri]MCY9864356.1 hypothetical protein [Vibrio coralliirubri]
MISNYEKYLNSDEPSYWNEISESWKSKKGSKYVFTELDSSHRFVKYVENLVNDNISARKVIAPRGEKTRMNHAHAVISDVNSSEMATARMSRRLRECKGEIDPPESANISIRSLKVIKNESLLMEYKSFLRDNYSLGPNSSNKIGATKFQSKFQSDEKFRDFCAPILNRRNGELMLFHGTSPHIGDLIARDGFRPELGKQKKSGLYGMLGQGTYFSDNFSKVMTYSTCPLCGDYSCFCRDISGRKFTKTALISRVCLGHSKLFPHIVNKVIKNSVRTKFKKVSAPVAKTLGYNSVVSRGSNNRLWRISSGNNEFMITGASQAYPEIVFDYVIGNDDISNNNHFISLVASALNKYSHVSSFRKSRESQYAARTLTGLVLHRKCENLVSAVNYYMSVSTGNNLLSAKYGKPLKSTSRLYKELYKVMIKSGAYQDY